MKGSSRSLVLVCSALVPCLGSRVSAVTPRTRRRSPTKPTPARAIAKSRSTRKRTQNAHKAKSIIEAGIQALGGQTYLTIRDREQQGRGYGFPPWPAQRRRRPVLEFLRVSRQGARRTHQRARHCRVLRRQQGIRDHLQRRASHRAEGSRRLPCAAAASRSTPSCAPGSTIPASCFCLKAMPSRRSIRRCR